MSLALRAHLKVLLYTLVLACVGVVVFMVLLGCSNERPARFAVLTASDLSVTHAVRSESDRPAGTVDVEHGIVEHAFLGSPGADGPDVVLPIPDLRCHDLARELDSACSTKQTIELPPPVELQWAAPARFNVSARQVHRLDLTIDSSGGASAPSVSFDIHARSETTISFTGPAPTRLRFLLPKEIEVDTGWRAGKPPFGLDKGVRLVLRAGQHVKRAGFDLRTPENFSVVAVGGQTTIDRFTGGLSLGRNRQEMTLAGPVDLRAASGRGLTLSLMTGTRAPGLLTVSAQKMKSVRIEGGERNPTRFEDRTERWILFLGIPLTPVLVLLGELLWFLRPGAQEGQRERGGSAKTRRRSK